MNRTALLLITLMSLVLVACAPRLETSAAPRATETPSTTVGTSLVTFDRFPVGGASDVPVSGCAELPKDFVPSDTPVLCPNVDGYTDTNAAQLALMMEDKNFTLVNVHIPYAGDIPGTDLSIPYNTITEHLDQLPGKDQPIVLYCLGGPMSRTAALALVAEGYMNIIDLNYGMVGWERSGYELVKK